MDFLFSFERRITKQHFPVADFFLYPHIHLFGRDLRRVYCLGIKVKSCMYK